MSMERSMSCLALLLAVSCSEPAGAEPVSQKPKGAESAGDGGAHSAESPSLARPGGQGWLQGSVDERFALVARHLRGFDMAMVEVGYRHVELYWAGQDRNWGYAAYQLGKIETAVANGVQRRPKRAASARMLDGVVASVREAIDAGDAEAFERAFSALTATCNACHQAEDVAFMTVETPTQRLSPIRGRASDRRPENAVP
jgi:hypothetical protein